MSIRKPISEIGIGFSNKREQCEKIDFDSDFDSEESE